MSQGNVLALVNITLVGHVCACGLLRYQRQTGAGAQAVGEVLLFLHLCVIHPHHCAGALPGANVSVSWAQGCCA